MHRSVNIYIGTIIISIAGIVAAAIIVHAALEADTVGYVFVEDVKTR
jgi:hypothetical protein